MFLDLHFLKIWRTNTLDMVKLSMNLSASEWSTCLFFQSPSPLHFKPIKTTDPNRHLSYRTQYFHYLYIVVFLYFLNNLLSQKLFLSILLVEKNSIFYFLIFPIFVVLELVILIIIWKKKIKNLNIHSLFQLNKKNKITTHVIFSKL